MENGTAEEPLAAIADFSGLSPLGAGRSYGPTISNPIGHMPIQKIDLSSHQRLIRAEFRARWSRPAAIAAAVVFIISAAFPITAGVTKDTASFPAWWGRLDVGLAFVLAAVLAFAVMALGSGKTNRQAEEATYRAYRVLIHGILALLVVFFLFGDRIVWINCLTGFAWRAWLLLASLPEWFAAWKTNAATLPAEEAL